MGWKKLLAKVIKPSVRATVVVFLLLPLVSSIVVVGLFHIFINKSQEYILLNELVNRQRTMTEQIQDYVHMVFVLKQEDDRQGLRKLLVTYDKSLIGLENGGEQSKKKRPPLPIEVQQDLNSLKLLWQNLEPALFLVANQPTTSIQAIEAYNYFNENITRFRDLSNTLLDELELYNVKQNENLLRILIIFLIISAFLLIIAALIATKHIVKYKQMAETLSIKEKNFRTLFQSTPDPLIALNGHLDVLYKNNAFDEMIYKYKIIMNVSSEELYRRILSELKHYYHNLKHGTINIGLKASELVLEYNISKYIINGNSDEGIIVSLKDITIRKQAEQTIRKLSEVVEHSTDIVFITNPNGKINYVNPAFEKITGYSKDEAVGQNARILNSGKMSNKFYKSFWSTIHSGEIFHEEVINRKKNGELFIYDQTVTSLYSADGEIVNFISTGRDVTEQVKSREEIKKALADAKRANQVKTLFIANMSHEIRTPLNTIMGYISVIKDLVNSKINDKEKELFTIIDNSGKRLMRTIHEIMDISQMNSGTYKAYIEQIDLYPLIKELVMEFQIIAQRKGLSISFISKVNNAFIKADKGGILQALSNIIDNAIKYTNQGGIKVLLDKRTSFIVLTIQDTGIGIAKKYQEKMFDTFSQESEGYTKKFQGIGLGLAITKRHLDLNNGVPIFWCTHKEVIN